MIRLALPMLLALSTPALANPNCAGLPDALVNLAANYGEAARVTALMANGNLLVITVAPTGGWTALDVQPDGLACIVATGEAFEIADVAPEGDPA